MLYRGLLRKPEIARLTPQDGPADDRRKRPTAAYILKRLKPIVHVSKLYNLSNSPNYKNGTCLVLHVSPLLSNVFCLGGSSARSRGRKTRPPVAFAVSFRIQIVLLICTMFII